ncbi:MAG TPA: MarR family transcriptional regulator [Bacillota bacterium]|nr:MarR family transcriptional regulator [Bacillota bacterium]
MPDPNSAPGAEACRVEEVGQLVQRLVRMLQLFERDQIKPYGISSSQCYTLLEIAKSEDLSMTELSSRMNLDTSTMTRVIGNLVRDDLVERLRDKSDRRFVTVRLTPRGRIFAKQLQKSIESYYCDLVSAISVGQVDQVLQASNALVGAFEKANPEYR